jgi:hypothetical protein
MKIWNCHMGVNLAFVHVTLDYGLDDWWFESWQRLGICLFTTVSRPALEPTQPPIQWIPRALSLGVKQPGCETNYLPPSSAEVKIAWSYTSTLPVCLHEVKGTGTTLPLPLLLPFTGRSSGVWGLRTMWPHILIIVCVRLRSSPTPKKPLTLYGSLACCINFQNCAFRLASSSWLASSYSGEHSEFRLQENWPCPGE